MTAPADLMSLAEFEHEVRRNARFDTVEPVANPLAAAVLKVNTDPAYSQSRLLARVLHALADQSGQFRRAEISGFDSPTLRLVVALMNAQRAGSNTRDEWLKAVADADAATNR